MSGGEGWFHGEKLQCGREFRGLSIAQLARKCGVNKRDLIEWESDAKDRPDGIQLEKLAKVLDFPIAFFLAADSFKLEGGFMCGSGGCEAMTEPERTQSARSGMRLIK